MGKEINIKLLNVKVYFETEKGEFENYFRSCEVQNRYTEKDSLINDETNYLTSVIGPRKYLVFACEDITLSCLAGLCASFAFNILDDMDIPMSRMLIGGLAEELFGEMNVNKDINLN